MSHKAVIKLIKFCQANKELYGDLTQQVRFYREASRYLQSVDCIVTPKQCADEMTSLESKLNTEKRIEERSCAAAYHSQWPYYEEMMQLSGDRVTVEPKITVACGTTFEVRRPADNNSGNAARFDVGKDNAGGSRERPSKIKKPMNAKMRKAMALENLTHFLMDKYKYTSPSDVAPSLSQ